MSENEKDKDIKKTSEAESYGEYEGEAMEDITQGSRIGEISTLIESSSSSICESTITEVDINVDQGSRDSYEERKKQLLMEKWLTVTGKKPRNIPNLRKQAHEGRYIFFGDRKPGEVEKHIKRKLLIAAHKIEMKGLKFGKIRQEVQLPALFSGLQCIRFDSTGERMVCADRKGGVQVRDSMTGNVILDLSTIEQNDKLAIRSLRYSPVNPEMIYVVGQTGTIQVFNDRTAELLGSSEPLGSTYNMDICHTGAYLVTVGKEGRINVVDPNTLQVISRRVWPGEIAQPNQHHEYHKTRIYGLRFHPINTTLFATGGWDDTVKIWDIRGQGAIRSISGPSIHGDGLDIRENVILTATWRVENSLSMWDFVSGKLIKNIPIRCKSTRYEGEFLYTCRFFKNDSVVSSDMAAIGGSGFSDVIIINVKTDKVEQYFPSFKPIMCLDLCGNLLAYGGKESVFRIAEVDLNAKKYSLKK